MELALKSTSPECSLRIGAVMAGLLQGGDVLRLEGDMGTGKTVLVRGFARGRGLEGPVPSPTFTIINPYPRIGLCHVDAFRLSGPEELLDAGIEEYLDGGWVCAVEWARRVEGALPQSSLEVGMSFGKADNDRLLELVTRGEWNGRADRIASELMRCV